MHELSIAHAVIGEVEAAARIHGARHVTGVSLEVGRLSGIVPGALVFGFEIASEGTLCEGAELRISEMPVVAWCPDGDHPVELAEMVFRCPDHGCPTPEVLSGKQLEITSFEISDTSPHLEPGSVADPADVVDPEEGHVTADR